MSMRDLRDINNILEVAEDTTKYPRLALILVKKKAEELSTKLEDAGIYGETLEQLNNAQYRLDIAI